MLKSYPLVTSVVLCYKKYDHIYEAINSILTQDYPSIELIISDDASGDFPEMEIREFIERNKTDNLVNFKIIINERNLGTVRNINGAFKSGNGKYFIGLSNDDVFYDCTVMRRIVERFEETGFPILSCRRLRCTEDGLISIRQMPNNAYIPIITRLSTPEQQFRAFATGFYYEMASGSTTYFTRKHFEEWGYFDEAYILWEDGPFYAQYTRAGNLIPMAYDIISIKYREGGISGGKQHPLILKDHARFIDVECYQHLNCFNKTDQRIISFLYQKSHQYQTFSRIKKVQVLIKYIDVVIYKICYKLYCSLISQYEKLWKNKFLKE